MDEDEGLSSFKSDSSRIGKLLGSPAVGVSFSM